MVFFLLQNPMDEWTSSYGRSRDGAVVKALAVHQCEPGSTPAPPCPKDFSTGMYKGSTQTQRKRRALKRFMGKVNHFEKFIPFNIPLCHYLFYQETKWYWEKAQQKAFQQLTRRDLRVTWICSLWPQAPLNQSDSATSPDLQVILKRTILLMRNAHSS